MDAIRKYPRTAHIEGSGLQKGDDGDRVPFIELAGKPLVVEEKLDGANVGIWFKDDGEAVTQSRGHVLTGGPGEAQFALLKTWVSVHQSTLRDAIGTRYILYGEWLYAKHTVFYDMLPHYLTEFDLLDRKTGEYLSTARRYEILAGTPVVSVPVVHEGAFRRLRDLTALVRPSLYKSPQWRESLRQAQEATGADVSRFGASDTDDSDLSEGLYVKWEENGIVRGRYKWVRTAFIQTILDSGTHWRDRILIPNGLRADVDIFGL
ncbi:MAG: RNA ligase family protein [Fibrella sp.]|nr:RNA ligase family protein [Armatimonadota bacterium]